MAWLLARPHHEVSWGQPPFYFRVIVSRHFVLQWHPRLLFSAAILMDPVQFQRTKPDILFRCGSRTHFSQTDKTWNNIWKKNRTLKHLLLTLVKLFFLLVFSRFLRDRPTVEKLADAASSGGNCGSRMKINCVISRRHCSAFRRSNSKKEVLI